MQLLRKTAGSGSDAGTDQPFEQSFANLAHAYLADRAPALLDYEVGFQLVDRDDDDNKAVGVFGFKVGSNWLYAPVFFIGGDLKGSELLYMKNQDSFVPNEEGWITYILGKKPVSLGEGVDRNTRQLGVHYPDMFRALMSPHKYASHSFDVTWAEGEKEALKQEAAKLVASITHTKSAAAVKCLPPWAQIAVITLVKAANTAIDEPFQPKLLDLLKTGGAPAVQLLRDHLAMYPKLQHGFEAFYPADDVVAALEKAATVAPRGLMRKSAAAPLVSLVRHPNESLTIINRDTPTFLLDQTDAEAVFRSRNGLLIKDAREDEEISKAYAVNVKVQFEQAFRNPTDTGVYDVLTQDGTLEKCLVVVGPQSNRGSQPWCTVVCLDENKKAWLNIHQSYVWVEKEHRGWKEWFEGLPKADTCTDDMYYLAIGSSGEASVPFKCKEDKGADDGGGKVYKVWFEDYCRHDRPANSLGWHSNRIPFGGTINYYSSNDHYCDRIHLGRKTGSKIHSRGGELYIPENFRLLELEKDKKDEDKKKDEIACDGPCFVGHSDAVSQFKLGDALDIEMGIFAKTAALEIRVAGNSAHLNKTAFPDRKSALIALVRDHGFREKDAQVMLDEAAAETSVTRGPITYRVKYADGYGDHTSNDPYLTHSGPYAPVVEDPWMAQDSFMGSGFPSYYGYEQLHQVPDLRPDIGNRDAYKPIMPDPQALQTAQTAQQQGQKELFDTSMVGSMLRATTDDQLVDRHIGDLMKGMDRKGRLLMAYYWHGDKFAERYGQNEMPELEDALLSAFTSDGKLTLFLKQKTIEASPETSMRGTDLGDVD